MTAGSTAWQWKQQMLSASVQKSCLLLDVLLHEEQHQEVQYGMPDPRSSSLCSEAGSWPEEH
jgi:hypothetical protein